MIGFIHELDTNCHGWCQEYTEGEGFGIETAGERRFSNEVVKKGQRCLKPKNQSQKNQIKSNVKVKKEGNLLGLGHTGKRDANSSSSSASYVRKKT